MNYKRYFLKNNDCYKKYEKYTPQGIMVHSTGANNPTLRRYLPDFDGTIGDNPYGNHWDVSRPSGNEVCVCGFIGKLMDNTIATVQTLPTDCVGWHCGGSGNRKYFGFEVCEDALTSADYFWGAIQEAIEFCVYLIKHEGIPNRIIDHAEGYKAGEASNHADITHWMTRFDYSMDKFRQAVNNMLALDNTPITHLYRVRKSWDDIKSQVGAYSILDNATRHADKEGLNVYDELGNLVYTGNGATTARLYRVRKSATDAKSQLGAYKVYENAVRMMDANPGYHIYSADTGEQIR